MNIPCICPSKGDAPRHPDGDEITFRERLDLRGSLAIVNDIKVAKELDPAMGLGEILAILTEGYLVHGIVSWTLRDDKNKPVECDKPAIRERILSDPELAMTLGDAADEVFAGQVMLPLLQRALNFSPPSPTDESTSRTNGSPPKAPKRSKRSSITTFPTAVTVTTSASPDGDSNSSQSSTSAA